MENIERLTELQKSIGYVPGEVSPVAMLGLMGEVGEVAAEAGMIGGTDDHIWASVANDLSIARVEFIDSAHDIDDIKKTIRFEPDCDIRVICNDDKDSFNVELSDVFYYLNAIAIGRGLTLDDLARISYEKVMRKRATIGPEIPGK